MIDIAMTATIRPEIIDRTLASLVQNLKASDDFRLIVDVAPVGDLTRNQSQMVDVITSHYSRVLIRAIGDSPQAEALKWTWENVTSDFFLQWEDDWTLEKPLDMDVMIGRFERFSTTMGVLCLDRCGKSVLDYPGYKGCFIPYSPQLWIRTKGASLGGPPALMRKAYARDVLPIVDGKTCLDVLSNKPIAKPVLTKWATGVYLGEDSKGNLVQDIGKEWRKEHNLVMVKDTPRGVTWIKRKA